MSRSKGKLHRARVCPWCGTSTLERDYFNPATPSLDSCVAFLCTNCNTGFSLRESPRAMFVNRMYALERKQRPPNNPGGGCPPLTERPLDELRRIETLLAAKKPRGRANREGVEASLAAVRKAIEVRDEKETLKQECALPPAEEGRAFEARAG